MSFRTSRRILTVAVVGISLFSFASILSATEKTASVEGLVTKVDRTAKTLMVKASDGTEHTMHLVERTVVHGGKETTRELRRPHAIFRKDPRSLCTIQNRAQTRPLRRSI